MKTKKIQSCLLFLLVIFVSCKSLPVNEDAEVFNVFSNVKLSSPELKIYFPQFKGLDGKIIQGDGIVIILPDGKNIVIDGFLKPAENKYCSFLHKLGIKKIDYLVASHYHADHIGTFSKLISEFEVENFYSNGVPINTQTSRKFMKSLDSSMINTHILSEGDFIPLINDNFDSDCYIQVFGPIITDADKYNAFYNPGPTEKLINSTSLVFSLIYKDFSILFTGDMYNKGIKKICKKYSNKLECNILKVPHHGEWYTTNPSTFIKTVHADYGIIQDNRYITNTIFRRYNKYKTKLLYRNCDGYILVSSDGINYTISEETF